MERQYQKKQYLLKQIHEMLESGSTLGIPLQSEDSTNMAVEFIFSGNVADLPGSSTFFPMFRLTGSSSKDPLL